MVLINGVTFLIYLDSQQKKSCFQELLEATLLREETTLSFGYVFVNFEQNSDFKVLQLISWNMYVNVSVVVTCFIVYWFTLIN